MPIPGSDADPAAGGLHCSFVSRISGRQPRRSSTSGSLSDRSCRVHSSAWEGASKAVRRFFPRHEDVCLPMVFYDEWSCMAVPIGRFFFQAGRPVFFVEPGSSSTAPCDDPRGRGRNHPKRRDSIRTPSHLGIAERGDVASHPGNSSPSSAGCPDRPADILGLAPVDWEASAVRHAV